MEPSPADRNGRRSNGRFAAGNQLGRGNPMQKRVQLLRVELLKTVRPHDMAEIVAKLVALAKSGDLQAIKEVFDRTIGKPSQAAEFGATTSSNDGFNPWTTKEELERHLLKRAESLLQ